VHAIVPDPGEVAESPLPTNPPQNSTELTPEQLVMRKGYHSPVDKQQNHTYTQNMKAEINRAFAVE
jgi:hypothetical protein